MRILMGVHGLPPASIGGTELAALTLARALAERLEVTLFYPLRPEAIAVRPEGGAPPHAVPITLPEPPSRRPGPGGTPYDERLRLEGPLRLIGRTLPAPTRFEQTWRLPAAEAWLEELLHHYRPDLVHLHHLTGLSTRLPALAKARGIPCLLTLHDYWLPCARGQLMDLALEPCPGPRADRCAVCLSDQVAIDRPEGKLLRRVFSRYRPPERWLEPLRRLYTHARTTPAGPDPFALTRTQRRIDDAFQALEAATLLAAPSQHLISSYVRLGVPAGKLRFVDHGFPPRAPHPPPSPAGPLHIGFVGVLIPTKGVAQLLDACEQLPRDRVRLTLIGPSPVFHRMPDFGSTLSARARRLGVDVVGAVPPEAVAGWIERFHVLVLPSIWPENAPLVVGEAFRMGVPVVASRIGGIPERVKEGVNGRLFPAGDAATLASILRGLLDRPAELEQLRRGAWETPLGSSEAHLDHHLELYEALLRRGR